MWCGNLTGLEECPCQRGCVWKRSAFDLGDWIKSTALSNVSGHHLLLRGPNATKRRGKGEFPLFLNWDIHVFLPLDVSAPGSFVFGFWHVHYWFPQFSGLWPWTSSYTITFSVTRAFGFWLNYATSCPGSPGCRQRTGGLFGLHNHLSQFL